MKKILVFFVSILILSCASQPNIQQYNLSNGGQMYFIPATPWTGDKIAAYIDFNFKSGKDVDTICNMTITQKNEIPKGISSIVFSTNLGEYALSNVEVMMVESKTNSIRITSTMKQGDFIKIMEASAVSLKLTMNNSQYECLPSKQFMTIKTDFYNNYFALTEILK